MKILEKVREKEQTRKFGIANFAKDLLSIADNLGRALDAAPTKEDVEDQALENLVLGIQMTEQELQKAFEKTIFEKLILWAKNLITIFIRQCLKLRKRIRNQV